MVTQQTDARSATLDETPPYGVAAAVFAAVVALYAATIAPTTQFWDTSEYIAAAKTLGIPHPPGNPLFVLMANVWGMLPLVEHYALRINLFSAVTSALASAFLFLAAEQFLRSVLPRPRWLRYATGFAGVLVGATTFTVWNQSVVNEKVYTLSLLSIALCLWLGLRWAERPAGAARDRLLALLVYLLALTSTNHGMGLLVGPAIVVLGAHLLAQQRANAAEWAKLGVFAVLAAFLVIYPAFLRRGFENSLYYGVAALIIIAPAAFAAWRGEWRFAVLAITLFAVGVSVNLMLPIRAEHFPAINEGEPTDWASLSAVLTREQYQKGPLLERQAAILSQYANYLQYFGWQFAHDVEGVARRVFAALFGLLGILGAVRHWRSDRRGALTFTTLMLMVTLFLVFYLNFKYGFSMRPGENLIREVRERDYFFIASFQLWGVWTALGLGALLTIVADGLRERVGDSRRWIIASPILALSLIPLTGNALTAPRHGEWLPRDFAWDMLQSVEPYGILVTAGDNDTFPLWYMQEVEGVRRDVLVANLSLANTDWHPRQLKRRGLIPFDTAAAIDLYRGQTWPVPDRDAMTLSYEQIDGLPLLVAVPQDRNVLRLGENIRARIGTSYLEKADAIMIQLMRDNLGKRPIYFSRTVGGYADAKLGLTPFLIGHGLARKLVDAPLTANDSVAAVPTLGWVDMNRTRTLMFEYYHTASAARHRPKGWVDPASSGILSMYALLYAQYGDAQLTRADSAGMDEAALSRSLAREMGWQTGLFPRASR